MGLNTDCLALTRNRGQGGCMSVIKSIAQVNWKDAENKNVAEAFINDATEYMRRVEAHIFKGNEIRADQWMDYSEKQDEIKRLDRKRTQAHDKLLGSAKNFIDLLDDKTDFSKCEHRLNNRTQIADFVATIAFELLGMEPESKVEGQVRDELAEKIHNGEVTADSINEKVKKFFE